MQSTIELISLGATIPTIALSLLVVIHFYRESSKALTAKYRTAIQWFALGVVLGFLGSVGDNFYWYIPWAAKFLELDYAAELVDLGVYFNIPLRQGAISVAAYCHCRSYYAANLTTEDTNKAFLNRYIALSALLGAFSVLVLIWMKG